MKKSLLLNKIFCIFSYGLFSFNVSIAQINFYDNILPVLNEHCVKCHHESGPAPFSLTNYKEASNKSQLIKKVVEARLMPPWTADTGYRSFSNENFLSEEEILTIKKWSEEGQLKGTEKIINIKHHPGDIKPDYSLEMPQKFKIDPSGKDVFKRFHIPAKIENDINAYAFRFIPGNKIIHHTELFVDSTAAVQIDFSSDTAFIQTGDGYEQREKDVRYNNYEYATGWLPGINYEEFPAGTGLRIKKNSTFMFLIHYSPTPSLEEDRTKMNIYETKEKNIRYVETIALHANSDMVDGPLFLPANTIKTFHSKKMVENDFSAFALLPHAHHLAKSTLAFAVTPHNDTIPLLKINQWDFNWQFIYKLKNYIKLEKGTEIHFFATYDNTSANPENPFHPPQDIKSSFNVDDEMMEFFIWGVPYKTGDENEEVRYRLQ